MEFEAKLKQIEQKKAQVEKEEKELAVKKGVLLDSLNKESKALAEQGYTVTNQAQAQELLDTVEPQLKTLVDTLSSSLGIE